MRCCLGKKCEKKFLNVNHRKQSVTTGPEDGGRNIFEMMDVAGEGKI
jgi:hypothetical protein